MHQKITDIDELLKREAALTSQLLGSGLTSIRKYDIGSKGVFYSGMFSVSIGMERILKLILLLDYRIKNNNYPNNDFLKTKGHKIVRLIKDSRLINDELCIDSENRLIKSDEIFDDDLIKKIIKYLTEFSTSSRYYNLDIITGANQNTNEPLAHWDKEICKIILNRHPPSKKKLAQYEHFANSISDITMVQHTHEDGSSIDNAHALFMHSACIEEKQEYSVYYLYKIIDYSVQLLVELDCKLQPQLYLREFFENLFMYNPTCSSVRRRKDWCRV